MNETTSLRDKIKALPWKRIGLIAGPALLVLLAALILVPKPDRSKAPAEESAISVTAEPVVIPTAELKAAETPEPEEKAVTLQAEVTEADLLVKVCDENGEPIPGVKFQLRLTYPDGSDHVFQTGTDGRLYRIGVGRGEYKISLLPQQGYKTPESITATVEAALAYTPIENVRENQEVVGTTDLPAEETRPVNAGGAATPTETIETPTDVAVVDGQTNDAGAAGNDDIVIVDDAAAPAESAPAESTADDEVIIIGSDSDVGPGAIVSTQKPVLDASGNQTYTYTYSTGASGKLLLASTGEESDVLPVEENGVLRYGLRMTSTTMRSDASGVTVVDAIPDEPEEGVEYYTAESSEQVTLFNADNTPVADYMITASPVVHTDTILVGWQTENGVSYYYDSAGNKVTGLKQIDGKLYYFTPGGAKASSLGIDVSFYNGSIDWYAVRDMGIDFAIIRLGGRGYSSGVLFQDDMLYTYLQGARDAGLRVGAYFYSSAVDTNEAVQEASLAVELLGGAGLDMPLYIDMERSPGYPNGRADKLSAQAHTEIAQAFCTTVEAAGYRSGVYSNQNYFYDSVNYSALSSYNIWMASYTNNIEMPSFRHSYNVWQCTSTAAVRGISGGVDLNIIF